MSKRCYLGICALALSGSFGGTFLANRGVVPVHAQAQETTDLRARSLTVIDQRGRTVATLGATGLGAELTVSGNNRARVEIDGSGAISIHNPAGRLVWNAPSAGIMPASE
jgi:hypothetical protein